MPLRFTSDGLAYETHGETSAPAVVFLNGTAQTTLYWQNIARQLRRRRRVVLYDQRGQGHSPPADALVTAAAHLDDLEGLLDDLDIDRADLVGLSHGAYLAAACAAHRPGRVGRLILCGAGDAPTPEGRSIIDRWIATLEREGIERLAAGMLRDVFGPRFLTANADIQPGIARAIVRRNDAVSLAALLRAVQHYPPLTQVARPGPPCLVVGGERDPLAPPEAARRLAAIYAARYVCLPEIGHSVPVEAGPVFQTLVEEFLGLSSGDG